MAEYIKRKDAIDLFWTVDTENNGDDGYTVVIKFGRCYDSTEIEALLSKLPAADAVSVVRCRECKYHKPIDYCTKHKQTGWFDDDFCSRGQLKEDEHES